MPNTFSQIHIQVIFAVKHREALIDESWRQELFEYTAGILKNKDQKPLIIGGVADHIHIFFGYNNLVMPIPDLVREIKKATNAWVKEKQFTQHNFAWQEGYGAFSYSRSQVDSVYQYVLNQEEHHKKQTFREEYLLFLKKFDVPYDERYLFDFFD